MIIEARSEHGEECNICCRRDSDCVRIKARDKFPSWDDFPSNNSDLGIGWRMLDDSTRPPKIGDDSEYTIRIVDAISDADGRRRRRDEQRAAAASRDEILLPHDVDRVIAQVVQIHGARCAHALATATAAAAAATAATAAPRTRAAGVTGRGVDDDAEKNRASVVHEPFLPAARTGVTELAFYPE